MAGRSIRIQNKKNTMFQGTSFVFPLALFYRYKLKLSLTIKEIPAPANTIIKGAAPCLAVHLKPLTKKPFIVYPRQYQIKLVMTIMT